MNNAISRVAGLLAIAVLGAAISAQFVASVEEDRTTAELGPAAQRSLERATDSPFAGADLEGVPPGQRAVADSVATEAAVEGFRLGALLAGLIAIAGGIVSAIGIRNPPRAGRESVEDPGERPVAAESA